jgi:hypothetical protein
MSHSRWSRLLPLLAVLSLLSSPVLAFGGDHARAERAPDFARTFWQFLGSLLPALDDARGTMDPNGQPSSGSALTETSFVEGDAQGTMDPNG